MASFYKYETVDIPLIFTPSGVLDGYKHIVVSLAQCGETLVNKTEEDDDLDIDVANDTITLHLSQEDTGLFSGGDIGSPLKANVQVNIYYNNTERDVSAVKSIDVYENLYSKVIEDEQ